MYKEEGLPIDESLIETARREALRYKYKKIFHLEPVEFEADGIRTEDPQTITKLHELTFKVYEDLGYEVISVPRFSNDKMESIILRTDFILRESNL